MKNGSSTARNNLTKERGRVSLHPASSRKAAIRKVDAAIEKNLRRFASHTGGMLPFPLNAVGK